MRYYQTIFVASALFSGLVSRVSGQTTYNIVAQTLALRTNSTPASLLNETSNTFNASLFITYAAEAIGITVENLIENNQTGLLLCGGTGDNDTETNGPHCDNSPTSGPLLADVIFDIAESAGAQEAIMADPTFIQTLPQLFLNVSEQLYEANSTAICVRLVNETNPIFTIAIVLVDKAEQFFPQVVVDLGDSVYPTTNVSDIWETCFGLDYESYTEDVNTAISEASKISEASILLQLVTNPELKQTVVDFLGLSSCFEPKSISPFFPF